MKQCGVKFRLCIATAQIIFGNKAKMSEKVECTDEM